MRAQTESGPAEGGSGSVMREIPEHEAWLQQRRKGIGASGISCLMGVPELNQYQSPWSLWSFIVDGPQEERGENHIADMGKRLEPVIARLFQDKAEYEGVLCDPGDYAIRVSHDTEIAFCTPDRELVRSEFDRELIGIVELKAAWHNQARKLIERVPLMWQCQVNWQLYCCELDVGYFAVLLDGLDFVWYRIERHEKLIKAMVKRATEFWERYVITRVPPPADYTEATRRAIAAHYSEPADEAVYLQDEAKEAHQQLESWKHKQEEAERHVNAAKNTLRSAIGNNTFGVIDGDCGYAWRPNKHGTRVLRYGKRRKQNG